jgi:hypothetical protein
VVIAFALLGFGLVPLGSKTGLQHTLTLLQTAPARDAASGFVAALGKARELLVQSVAPATPQPATEALPLPSTGGAVRPVPPKLRGKPDQRRPPP